MESLKDVKTGGERERKSEEMCFTLEGVEDGGRAEEEEEISIFGTF